MPHVTAAGLAGILTAVQNEGLPDIIDRNSMREARDLQAREATPFGPIVQLVELACIDGSSRRIPMASPFATLWTALSSCEKFAAFFMSKLIAKPPSPDDPWGVIIYSDEVTPGNPLSAANKRNVHAVYWSFVEFGANALSREESWFCVLAEYSSVVNNVHAKLSQVIAKVLKQFWDADGFDMHQAGMNLPMDGPRLFAKLRVVIQDGGAHKSTFHARGDGATKLCLLCKNVFTEKSRVCDEDGTNLLRCNLLRARDLVPATSKELRRVARYLASKVGTMTNEHFVELQQSLGSTYHPHALLLDRTLDNVIDPTSVYMHDWMHCLFVDGVINVLVYLLFEAFIRKGMNTIWETFADYVDRWTWPKRLHGAHLHEIFRGARKDSQRKVQHLKMPGQRLIIASGCASTVHPASAADHG